MAQDDLEDCWKDIRPTIGSLYGPAVEAKTEGEAKELFERLVRRAMSQGLTREDAEQRERQNISYYAGYYTDPKVWARVEQFYGPVAHRDDLEQFYGPVAHRDDLTPEAALQAGQREGEREGERIRRGESPIFCEHANEMPSRCPCDAACYCKSHSCRSRPV